MKRDDPLIDRSEAQKEMRVRELKAELKEILRQSVPTPDAPRYWELGWVYIMPDFDTPDHSIIEWQSQLMPVYPPRSEQSQTEVNAHDGTTSVRA